MLAENKQKMAERMGQIVEVCRYDAFETVKTDDGEEVEQTISKVDFTKFRREFVSLNMNEGIKVNIKEARIKKETAKIEKELEFHEGKMRKKPVKQQRVGGLTAEELHERVQKEKHEQHAARRLALLEVAINGHNQPDALTTTSGSSCPMSSFYSTAESTRSWHSKFHAAIRAMDEL